MKNLLTEEQRYENKKKIYKFLVNNHVGFENRIKSNVVRLMLDLECSERSFRKYIQEITEDEKFPLLICRYAGNDGGVFIAENIEECDYSINGLVRRAEAMQISAEHMERKKINMFFGKDKTK